MPSAETSKDPRDLIPRGQKIPTPLGRFVFIGLRALDPFLQYGILAHGVGSSLIRAVGQTPLPSAPPVPTGIQLIDALNLSPYRLILLAMAAGSALKQNCWLAFLSDDPMPPKAAVIISAFNTLVNSVNSLLFTCALTSASTTSNGNFPQTPLIVGATLYVVGLTTEWVAEVQRSRFKRDPRNKGKCYTGGLFSLARHINYGGYVLWRGGYALAAGGWAWGALMASLQTYDFINRAIPILDKYCADRYGEQWIQFKRHTPWRILPYIY